MSARCQAECRVRALYSTTATVITGGNQLSHDDGHMDTCRSAMSLREDSLRPPYHPLYYLYRCNKKQAQRRLLARMDADSIREYLEIVEARELLSAARFVSVNKIIYTE